MATIHYLFFIQTVYLQLITINYKRSIYRISLSFVFLSLYSCSYLSTLLFTLFCLSSFFFFLLSIILFCYSILFHLSSIIFPSFFFLFFLCLTIIFICLSTILLSMIHLLSFYSSFCHSFVGKLR